jgi:hypothetical protein
VEHLPARVRNSRETVFQAKNRKFLAPLFIVTSRPCGNLAPGRSVEVAAKDNVNRYLNAAASFSSGPQFGTLGRNLLRGPSQKRLDISVSRITPLREGTSLEFRSKFYNVTNTVNLRRCPEFAHLLES